jgi:hypothetical protein
LDLALDGRIVLRNRVENMVVAPKMLAKRGSRDKDSVALAATAPVA